MASFREERIKLEVLKGFDNKDITFITRAASLLSFSTAFFPFDAQVITTLQ